MLSLRCDLAKKLSEFQPHAIKLQSYHVAGSADIHEFVPFNASLNAGGEIGNKGTCLYPSTYQSNRRSLSAVNVSRALVASGAMLLDFTVYLPGSNANRLAAAVTGLIQESSAIDIFQYTIVALTNHLSVYHRRAHECPPQPLRAAR